jgi:hypothetical protein
MASEMSRMEKPFFCRARMRFDQGVIFIRTGERTDVRAKSQMLCYCDARHYVPLAMLSARPYSPAVDQQKRSDLKMIEPECRTEPPKVLSLARCAARCGALRAANDIYCRHCRAEITAEAWRLIEAEPDVTP